MKVDPFLHALPALVYRLDASGHIVYVNDEVLRFGYTPDELIGRDILELIPSEEHQRVGNSLRERRKGDRATKNLRIELKTKCNEVRQLEIRSRSSHQPVVDDPANPETAQLNLYSVGVYDKEEFVGTYGVAWDVTQEVVAEDLVRKLLDDSPVGFAIYDETGRLLMANEELKRMFGVLRSPRLQTHMTYFLAKVEHERAREMVEKLFQGETIGAEQFNARSLDGKRLSVEIRPRHIFVRTKRRILLTIMDLSERVDYDRRLKESEEKYRKIYEHANDAVLLIRDGKFVECNPRTLEMFGLTDKEEIIGKPPADFSPEFQPNRLKTSDVSIKYQKEALDGIPQRFDWWHIRKDGAPFSAEVVLSHIRLHDVDHLLAIVRDNSEIDLRMRLEEIASKMAVEFITLPLNDQASWQNIIQNAFREIVTLFQADGFSLYSVDESQQVMIREYYYYKGHEESTRLASKPIPMELLRGKAPEAKENTAYYSSMDDPIEMHSHVHKLMKEVGFNTSVAVPLMFRGKMVGSYNLSWYEKKKPTPSELRTYTFLSGPLAAILERKFVSEKETELTQQLYQAQKMEEVGRLSSGVAHDFNNLLTVILGNTELVRTLGENDGMDPEWKNELLEGIRSAAEMAANLTRQLLLFSRTTVANNKAVNLNDIVRSIEKMISRITPSNILKEAHLAETLPAVVADPTHVQQIILNLSVNAVDAMPGGGTLTLSTEACERHGENLCNLCGKPVSGDFVSLKIMDTGVGMPAEMQEHIFEPFFTTKESGKGTGLGLATVANIVRDYANGHLILNSTVGHGTEFEILFPCPKISGKSSVTETNHETKAKSSSLSGKVVLIEDNPYLVRLLDRVLTSNGMTVQIFNNAVKAWEWLENLDNSVELVVTDNVMPGMTGAELTRKLRQLRSGLPILFISGYAPDTEFSKLLSDHKVPFLAKPFTTTEFLDIVRDLVKK